MSWLDWLVVAAYGVSMLAIGAYSARRNRSAEDYLLAGRSMSPFVLGLSLFSTLMSSLSYLVWPGEVIAYGPMLLTQVAAFPIIAAVVGWGLIPLLMRQEVTSAYEILESRLGPGVRLAGSGVFLTMRLAWMATILYATAAGVLVPLFGADERLVPVMCAAMGLVTVVYSATGGLRAVVLTDAVQALTMIAGAICAVAVVTVKLGGVSAWWPQAWPAHWEQPSWGFDPSARLPFLTLVVSTSVWYICTNGSDQMSIQRFLATRDVAAARRTLHVSLAAGALIAALLTLTGVALLGFYRVYPIPIPPGKTIASVADQVFPRFITTSLPPGLAGLVIAAILSAAMSSLSSGVNSSCAVLEEDILPRLTGRKPSGAEAVARSRRMSWLIGLLAVALSLLNTLIAGNLLERCYKVVNLLTAPLFVLFFLALFVPWATALGAWLGLLASIATAVAVVYGGVFGVSFVWMMPASLVVGVAVGCAADACARLLAPRGALPEAPASPR